MLRTILHLWSFEANDQIEWPRLARPPSPAFQWMESSNSHSISSNSKAAAAFSCIISRFHRGFFIWWESRNSSRTSRGELKGWVERRWEYERWTKERRSENKLEGLWKWDAKPRLGDLNCENTRKFLTSKRDTFSLLLLFQLFLQLSVSSARPFSSLFPLRFHTRSSPPLYCSAFCLRNGPNYSSLLLCLFLQWFPSFPRLSLWSAESSLFVRICQCVLDFNLVEFSCEDQ